jgi:hypothetical protein
VRIDFDKVPVFFLDLDEGKEKQSLVKKLGELGRDSFQVMSSHTLRRTSRITHHTSHITHHTSHITHHTSHITHHTSPQIVPNLKDASYRVVQSKEPDAWKQFSTKRVARVFVKDVMVCDV